MPNNLHHKARVRQSIVFEAARVLRMGGPDAVGVAAIMAKLGLTHGGFYAYFRSIDELMAHAIMEIFNEHYAWMLTLTEGHAPDEALVRFIDAYLAPRHRDILEESCALPTLASYVPHMSQACRERFAEGTARLEAALAKMVATLGHKQAIQLASCALATMAGAIGLSRTISDRGSSDALLAAAKATVKSQLGLGKSSIGIASKDGSSARKKDQVGAKSKTKNLVKELES
jgi:TetR/AcrR family transcriptional regulator, transcriptional repressor for nem operon